MRTEQHFFTGQATLTDAQALGVCLGILQPDPAVPARTRQELADHFGVSQKTVSNFRRGIDRSIKRKRRGS
jgi:hypothetical protein